MHTYKYMQTYMEERILEMNCKLGNLANVLDGNKTYCFSRTKIICS